MQTEDFCPGTADFRALRERTGAFAGAEEIEIVGFANCGGCPGKKAVLRPREFVGRGADTIAFASSLPRERRSVTPVRLRRACRRLSGRISPYGRPARSHPLRPAGKAER